mgnify:CR=1 FL=1
MSHTHRQQLDSRPLRPQLAKTAVTFFKNRACFLYIAAQWRNNHQTAYTQIFIVVQLRQYRQIIFNLKACLLILAGGVELQLNIQLLMLLSSRLVQRSQKMLAVS